MMTLTDEFATRDEKRKERNARRRLSRQSARA